jgi:hypothetical protein
MAIRPPGWLGFGDMLVIADRAGANAQTILALKQSDLAAS